MQLDEIGTRPARYWHTAHNDDVLTVLDQVIGLYANQPCQLDFLVVL